MRLVRLALTVSSGVTGSGDPASSHAERNAWERWARTSISKPGSSVSRASIACERCQANRFSLPSLGRKTSRSMPEATLSGST